MFFAGISPLIFFAVTVFGIPSVRHFILASPSSASKMHDMPSHVQFRGPYRREREYAFRELGMFVEVRDDTEEYVRRAMGSGSHLFPEDVAIPPRERAAFPLAILRCDAIDAYLYVLTKDDGVVRKSDLEMLDRAFGGSAGTGGGAHV